jgi:hypothetical protein
MLSVLAQQAFLPALRDEQGGAANVLAMCFGHFLTCRLHP